MKKELFLPITLIALIVLALTFIAIKQNHKEIPYTTKVVMKKIKGTQGPFLYTVENKIEYYCRPESSYSMRQEYELLGAVEGEPFGCKWSMQ